MKLNPYLYFPGTCEEAMTTYAKVLGGEIVAMMTYGDMPGDNDCQDEQHKDDRKRYGTNEMQASSLIGKIGASLSETGKPSLVWFETDRSRG